MNKNAEIKVGDIVTPKKVVNGPKEYYCSSLTMGNHYEVVKIYADCIVIKQNLNGSVGLYNTDYFHVVKDLNHPLREVIIAWAMGQKIQCREPSGAWIDWNIPFTQTPKFMDGQEWRIKPENPRQHEIEQIEKEMRALADRLEKLRE